MHPGRLSDCLNFRYINDTCFEDADTRRVPVWTTGSPAALRPQWVGMSRTTSPPAERRAGAADQSAPILEHDPATESVLEPGRIPALAGIAERCVLCFFHDAIATMVSGGSATQVTELQSEMGPQPVYEFKESGRRLTLVQPGIGAPFSAAFMEELIALGCRHFIACGGGRRAAW